MVQDVILPLSFLNSSLLNSSVELLNILFVHKYLNHNLPTDILRSLDFAKVNHSIGTRGMSAGLLSRSTVNTVSYGVHSFSRIAKDQWNKLQKHFPNVVLSDAKISEVKTLFFRSKLNSYANSLLSSLQIMAAFVEISGAPSKDSQVQVHQNTLSAPEVHLNL